MSVVKVRHSRNYTHISNHPIEDEALTPEALGVLLYLMSKPDDWIVRPSQLQKRFSTGRDKMRNILSLLEDIGYIRRERVRSEQTGLFASTEYVVSDTPDTTSNGIPRPENPSVDDPRPENPSPENPSPENPTLLRLDDLPRLECSNSPAGHDYKLAFQLYNEMASRAKLPRAQSLNKDRAGKLRARLKEAGGIDGWKAAMTEVENSTFLTGANDRGWRANLDFILQQSSFTKIMEGQYRRGATRNARADFMDGLAAWANEGESHGSKQKADDRSADRVFPLLER
jgi:hypothetical protein